MKKLLLGSIILTLFAVSISIFQITSCVKSDAQSASTVCDIKGIYSGTSHASTGASSILTYQFRDNNFAVGSVTPTGSAVTFGGYRNTCDSIFLSVYYTSNSSYYLLKGKITNNGTSTTINGTFNNLTDTTNFGTFSISK